MNLQDAAEAERIVSRWEHTTITQHHRAELVAAIVGGLEAARLAGAQAEREAARTALADAQEFINNLNPLVIEAVNFYDNFPAPTDGSQAEIVPLSLTKEVRAVGKMCSIKDEPA